jgi:hypothetical protein
MSNQVQSAAAAANARDERVIVMDVSGSDEGASEGSGVDRAPQDLGPLSSLTGGALPVHDLETT